MKKIPIHQALARAIKDYLSEDSFKDSKPIFSEIARLYDEKACLFFFTRTGLGPSGGLAAAPVGRENDCYNLIAFTSLKSACRELKEGKRVGFSATPIPFSEVLMKHSGDQNFGGIIIDYLEISREDIGQTISLYGESTYTIHIELCDITEFEGDAIVNAANETLLGGGGVDGAIHRAAGPELLEACKKLAGCKTGEAKITAGFKLPARHVIHTVGPVYATDSEREKHLADCYFNSLTLARENNLHSIAFPAISTGAYGYPFKEASAIALAAINRWIKENRGYKIAVTFCFPTEDKCKAFLNILQSPKHSPENSH